MWRPHRQVTHRTRRARLPQQVRGAVAEGLRGSVTVGKDLVPRGDAPLGPHAAWTPVRDRQKKGVARAGDAPAANCLHLVDQLTQL
jgi:hypothetical protein